VKVNNSNPDTTPPTVSISAPASGATVSGTISVTANASDNVGVASVQFQLDGANFGSLDTAAPYSVSWNTTTSSNASHTLRAIAKDAAGNSATSANVTVTVNNGSPDTTPPSVPTGLTATAVSSSQINLFWTASTDNVGVTGYNVYRAGAKIGTSPNTAYQDAGLAASTSYTYTVSAFDAAGNTSAQSAGASATTQASSSGSGIPSTLGWYQVPNTNIRPLCPSYSEIQANEGCTAVMADWSGGLFDTKRNRFIIWGGGHQGYFGNEIYGIDLSTTPVSRLLVKDAAHGNAVSNVSSCPEAYLDGTPDARHNYSGLVYAASRDKYFMWSGSKSSCGFFSDGLWQFDPATNTWTQIMYSGTGPTPAGSGSSPVMAYDDVNDALYVMEHNAAKFWRYTFSDNAWHVLFGGQGCNALDTTSTIDTSRRLFMCAGNGQMDKMLLDPPYTRTQVVGTGCSAVRGANGPGFTYDPVNKVEVGWVGGNTAYIYNPDTDSCTSQTYPGGPTTLQANGTYGRFRYSPATGVFIVANDIDSDAYTLRLTAQSGGTTGGPAISNISVNGISTTGASVSWTTDVASTSQVEYGTTAAYGTLTTLNSSMVTSHTVSLTGLATNTLYHYRVHSKNASGVESISGDAVFSTNNTTDTTPPTVSMTVPASGATVSGTVTVSANASDNVGVASVQFTLDGANLGSALTASPYQVAWDTTTAANGSHSLTAVAKDAAGNTATASAVAVTVSNTGSGNTALQDFQSRCATSGVIVCEGFDNASEFTPGVSPNTGVYPGGDNTIEIKQDTSVFASGGGSLHFPIKANDGSGPTVRDDNWLQTFCSAHPPAGCTPTVFAQNSTFYVQFRYRVDAGYASTNWEDPANGGSSPKIADFANHTSSCGQTEITTNNRNGSDMPMMYTSCGARGFFVTPGTTNWNSSTPPYLWENGYYNCAYPFTPSGQGGCFTMPANTWMTFYYRIALGTWGQPNSQITAWIAIDGQSLEKFVDVSNMNLGSDTPGYDAIWFNVYMTGFSGSATNPAANAWLDEVIVSSAPIPAPAANGGGIPQ
jgi:chitodextrinase